MTSGTSSNEPWRNAFTPARLLLILAGFIFALYPEVVLGTHSFFDRDFGLFTYPVAWHTRESIWRGEIPLWNPLSNCGIPFLAQWNTSVCYPLSWLYLVFPLPWSLNYFCLGHLLIAGLGMYLLAYRWFGDRFGASIGGIAFALNGLMFNCLMWTSNLAALSWFPLVVLWVERGWREGGRSLIIAAAVSALQMLSGAPEIIAMTWLVVGGVWLTERLAATPLVAAVESARPAQEGTRVGWRAFSRVVMIVGLVCGLAAIQLLPFFELLSESSRKTSTDNAAFSMPAWGLANFLVPLFRCERSLLGPYFQVSQQWTSSYYLGVAPLLLALLALWKVRERRIWLLAAVAMAGLLLALGQNAIFYPLLAKIIPGFTIARYPIKFISLTAFAVPLLAASAVARIEPSTLKRLPVVFFPALMLVLTAVAIVVSSYLHPTPNLSFAALAQNGAGRVLTIVATAWLLGAIVRATTIQKAKWLGLALVLVFGADAVTHTARQNPTVSNRAYGPLDLEMDRPEVGKSRAMVSPRMQALLTRSSVRDPLVAEVGNRRSLFEDSNLIDGVPKVNGFFSIYLRQQPDIDGLLYNPTNFPASLVDFLGVTQLLSADRYWKWEPRFSAWPLVTAGQEPHLAEREETLKQLAAADFDPAKTVWLPTEVRGQLTATGDSRARVLVTQREAHQIAADILANTSAIIVVAQSYARNWKAFVDGRPAPLWRANYGFQATQVPAGRHQVRFVYRDYGFYIGTGVSILTGAGCGLYFWLAGPRRKAGQQT